MHDTGVGFVEGQLHQQFARNRLRRCLSARKALRAREELWLVGGTASLQGLAGRAEQSASALAIHFDFLGRRRRNARHQKCPWLQPKVPLRIRAQYVLELQSQAACSAKHFDARSPLLQSRSMCVTCHALRTSEAQVSRRLQFHGTSPWCLSYT